MISFDNQFKLSASSLGIEKDNKRATLVSHAHSDHLPSSYSNNNILCSKITKKIIHLKKRIKSISTWRNNKIKMLDAGHILGSKMFLINNKLLYTGDFNTQNSHCGKAKPVKCSTLIMECTYGLPNYIFPSREEVIKEIKEYLDENDKAIITSIDSNFGKVQEICSILENLKIPFNVSPKVLHTNKYLGIKFKYLDEKASVIVSDPYTRFYNTDNYKRIHLSGWWATGSNFLPTVDKGIVFSNHCDFPSLVEFVKKCNPNKIYTQHGYCAEFANHLKKIGFDASPLKAFPIKKREIYQSTLFSFN